MKKSLSKIRNAVAKPYHFAQAIAAATKYNYPASGMKVIGVTGTNGKTTTCSMIFHMLRESGKNVGLMTTVTYGVGDDLKPQSAHMTTESTGILNKRIAEIRDAGAEYLVLEVSSHALSQHRIFGVPIDIAVMTNVTHEHLDYHGTFEKYRDAKRKLFKMASKNRHGKKVGVINTDDPSAQYFANDVRDPITYGIDAGDLVAKNVELRSGGVSYDFVHDGEKFTIQTQIPGKFNVYNSLAAAAVGIELGLAKTQIEHGISSLTGVEGRMNRIIEGQDFDVLIDFGHTPDAFEKVFSDMRTAVKGKMIVVFGSPGQRDVAKRAIQGEIAGKYCDEIILTEDDPRDTPVREISEMIAKGAEKAGKTLDEDLFMVDDRTEAIEFAFRRAKPGDAVLLMSKGHEKSIFRASGDEPWNEAEVARGVLRKLAKKSE